MTRGNPYLSFILVLFIIVIPCQQLIPGKVKTLNEYFFQHPFYFISNAISFYKQQEYCQTKGIPRSTTASVLFICSARTISIAPSLSILLYSIKGNSQVKNILRDSVVNALFIFNASPISFTPLFPILLFPINDNNDVQQKCTETQRVQYIILYQSIQILFLLLLQLQSYCFLQNFATSILYRDLEYLTHSSSVMLFQFPLLLHLQSPSSPVLLLPIKLAILSYTERQRNERIILPQPPPDFL
eukprot:TRINITY_DN659_c0_g1_i8.p1 TRINITY_DN659_c0_g1~~TRINITY_DN659_c0_g1_i8.p1  ORF type:complete len:268 (+),score=-36.13 TRINITY_DN659_c0_g1_i8:76-804(+)